MANNSSALIEKEEENKLHAKYPTLASNRQGVGSLLLQKRLNKGHRFFDSGDYNMAMAKYKKGAQQNSACSLPSQKEENTNSSSINTPELHSSTSTKMASSSISSSLNVRGGVGGTLSSSTTATSMETVKPTLTTIVHKNVDENIEVHQLDGDVAILLHESTGDTIPTPDNVPAVARKKSLFATEEISSNQQHFQQRHNDAATKYLEPQQHCL